MPANSQLRLYELQWQYANKLKLQPQTYINIQRFYNFRDSLEAITKSTDTNNMNVAFKAHDQRYKLALLTQENKTKKSTSSPLSLSR